MDYKATEHFNKRFFIDLGLRPGYDEKKSSFSLEDVKEWYMVWQKDRAEKELSFFAGIVTATNFVYAFKSNGEVKGMHEPSVRIEGEITKEHHAEIFDNEEVIMEIIFDLANTLGVHTKQERVHIMFDDKFFVLEKNK